MTSQVVEILMTETSSSRQNINHDHESWQPCEFKHPRSLDVKLVVTSQCSKPNLV
jgi:hypothetical protein